MSRPGHEWFVDGAALAALGGVLGQVLPPLAALFAVAWYAVLLWESDTGRRWRIRWKTLYWVVRRREVLIAEDRVAFLILLLSGAGLILTIVALIAVI